MTIYEIKRLTAEKAQHFFSREAMKFFGQTLRDFKVSASGERKIWEISAPIYGDDKTRPVGSTRLFFYRDDLYTGLEDAIHARDTDEKREHEGEYYCYDRDTI